MGEHVRLRAMTSDDTPEVASLLSSSFEERVRPYVPYCRPGVEHYLATTARHPAAFTDHHLYVAVTDDDRVAGFAEFRSLVPASDLLSYICVAPDARGLGLAEALIRHHVDGRPGLDHVQLDVFADNQPARSLYRRLGFHDVSSTDWWSRPLPAGGNGQDGGSLHVRDWHVSHAVRERYGFCMVDVDWAGSSHRLGLPSPTVVRVPDEQLFRDDDLLSGLRHLVPTLERCLWIGTDSHRQRTDEQHVLRSCRLSARAPLLGARP